MQQVSDRKAALSSEPSKVRNKSRGTTLLSVASHSRVQSFEHSILEARFAKPLRYLDECDGIAADASGADQKAYVDGFALNGEVGFGQLESPTGIVFEVECEQCLFAKVRSFAAASGEVEQVVDPGAGRG
jgi:hypothetical protein